MAEKAQGEVPPPHQTVRRVRDLGPHRREGFSKVARDPDKAKAPQARLVPVVPGRKVYV